MTDHFMLWNTPGYTISLRTSTSPYCLISIPNDLGDLGCSLQACTMEKFLTNNEVREQRYQFLAKTAAELIAENGIEELSIRNVAKRAGCSKGLVEHYFDSRGALINAAHNWVNEQCLERVQKIPLTASGIADLIEHLRALMPFDHVLFEWKVRIVHWHQSTIDINIALRKLSVTNFRTVYDILRKDLIRAQENEEINGDADPGSLAEILLFYLFGLCIACFQDEKLRSAESLEARLRFLKLLVTSGEICAITRPMKGFY